MSVVCPLRPPSDGVALGTVLQDRYYPNTDYDSDFPVFHRLPCPLSSIDGLFRHCRLPATGIMSFHHV